MYLHFQKIIGLNMPKIKQQKNEYKITVGPCKNLQSFIESLQN